MRAFFFYFLSIFLIISCSTSTKETLPPKALKHFSHSLDFSGDMDRESFDLQLLGLLDKYPHKTTKWWVNYRRARLWEKDHPGLSCPLYMELSRAPQFPLKDVAFLRAFTACEGAGMRHLPQKKLNPHDYPKWIQGLALDIALQRVRNDKDQVTNMELALHKSKQPLPQGQKVEYTKEALELANAIGNKKAIKKLQARLYKLSPKTRPRPQPNEYLDVAYDYRRYREFAQARLYYSKVIQGHQFNYGQKVKAYKGIRISYKLERRHPEYMRATQDLARYIERIWKKFRHPPRALTRQYHRVQILLARTHWTLGQTKEAKKVLLRLAHKLKGKHHLAKIYWLHGRMAEEQGHYKEAVEWFDKSLVQIKAKHSSIAEKIRWYRAWNLRKLQKYKEAKASLIQLRQETESNFSRSRYSFWLSLTHKNLGEKDQARMELESLAKNDPIGYYGLLAHRELNTPVTVDGLIKPLKDQLEKNKKVPDYRGLLNHSYIEWLIAVGEKEIANKYLDQISEAYRRYDNQEQATWVGLFRYYARSGVYLSLYSQLGKLEPVQRNSILNRYPELIFPTPYREHVNSASNRYGVSLELIYSIMRQESAFNPEARSSADAFGLMQLLPEVARKTAEKNYVSYKETTDLYEPHINIPIGSAYLRELWDKFNGQFILTVASYNASERAIYSWLRTRFRGNTLEFIEDIPYEETRGYVRLVMRNLVFYSLVTSKKPTIPFPEWCLALSAPSTLQ